MKTTTSTIVNKVIADSKKLTSSPIERRMIQNLLIFGTVRTVEPKGYSNDDRTEKIVSLCNDLGLKIKQGNDAPKGGKRGNYIDGNEDELIFKYVQIQKRKARILSSIEKRKDEEAAQRRNEQKKELVELFKSNTEFKAKIQNRIETSSSKKWRNWVRMKVASILVGDFKTLELSAADIRDIVYND